MGSLRPPDRFTQMLWAMLGGAALLVVGTFVLKGLLAFLTAAGGIAVVIICGYRGFIAYDDWKRRTPTRERA
jgi:hypothetical protein